MSGDLDTNYRLQDLENRLRDGLQKLNSPVDHPAHYNQGKFEVIDVIDDWKLGFCLGNAVKYIARAGHKDKNPVEDLNKAIWYIQHEIKLIEAGKR